MHRTPRMAEPKKTPSTPAKLIAYICITSTRPTCCKPPESRYFCVVCILGWQPPGTTDSARIVSRTRSQCTSAVALPNREQWRELHKNNQFLHPSRPPPPRQPRQPEPSTGPCKNNKGDLHSILACYCCDSTTHAIRKQGPGASSGSSREMQPPSRHPIRSGQNCTALEPGGPVSPSQQESCAVTLSVVGSGSV